MKRFVFAFALILLFCSCCTGASERHSPEDPALFTFEAHVEYVDLEGGFYGLVTADGRRFDPIHLPDEFRQDGIKVRVKARKPEPTVGFHMWGQKIEILTIEER